MDKLFCNARYLKTETDPRNLGPAATEFAFVGRSNVGKSSLINALCRRRDLARTSRTPGRTRAINVYDLGGGCRMIDLPGYGFASGPEQERSAWKEMIEGYLTGRLSSLRMVFVLVDAFVGPTDLDRQMVLWLTSYGIPFRIVANKADRVPVPEQESRKTTVAAGLGLAPEHIFWVSARKGSGIDAVQREIAEIVKRC